jgi:hypothetical protein
MRMKISTLFWAFLLTVFANQSFAVDLTQVENSVDEPLLQLAAVSFTDKPSKPKPAPKKRKAKSRSIKPLPRKIEQYDIEGYIDQQYVRVVLEVADKQTVVGNIYDSQGKGVYVHGEYLDGALHVYDPEGTHFTIILNE